MTFRDSYREYAPVAALREYVSCYWSSRSPASSREHRVLPDGCIDIIFDLSPGQCPHGKVVGTMTGPLIVRATSPVELVAVRFRPGGATPLLRLNAHELTDIQIDLGDAWRADGLAERLLDESEMPNRVRQLEQMLHRRLGNSLPVDGRVRAAVSLLESPRQLEVGPLAGQLGLSRQHLARLFRRHVGIGPKEFARVNRMQRTLATARATPQPKWARIALDAGYCDQAHMINECRSLTGQSPGELVES